MRGMLFAVRSRTGIIALAMPMPPPVGNCYASPPSSSMKHARDITTNGRYHQPSVAIRQFTTQHRLIIIADGDEQSTDTSPHQSCRTRSYADL